jgi:predicted CopG family antitoxin
MQEINEQTSIRVSKQILELLKSMKTYPKESYDEVIWELIEPHLELNDKTKQDIGESIIEYEKGDYFTLEELEEKYGLGE